RPRPQRALRRHHPGAAQSLRRHHLQTRRPGGRQHDRHHAGRCSRSPEDRSMLQFPKPYADAVARLRVPSGFLIVLVFAWLSHPTASSLALGVPVSILGLALRAWAAGCLAKNQQLATGGPYAYTRNPLYIGTLLVALGLTIAARNPYLAVLFALVFVLVYLPVIQLEEQHLRRLFPEYATYAK